MRGKLVMASVMLALGCGSAAAQYGARSDDPCTPAARTGNALLDLAAALGQRARQQSCVSERQAQWNDYNARQKAARDQAAAQAAAQAKAAADQAQADQRQQQQLRLAAASARARASEARARRAAVAAASARVQSAHQQQAAQLAETAQRLRYVALVHAEASAENYCHTPKLARGLLDGWSGLDAFKDASIKAIDIEHLTTVYFHQEDQSFSCHGVFVTNTGLKIVGTATVKRNVAGDPMFVWTRDASQDLSAYDAPAPADAMSPEMATQTKMLRPIKVDALSP